MFLTNSEIQHVSSKYLIVQRYGQAIIEQCRQPVDALSISCAERIPDVDFFEKKRAKEIAVN
ncbi:MAG: hypothetical protein ACFCU6_03500 [Balneolaceae bacterium]